MSWFGRKIADKITRRQEIDAELLRLEGLYKQIANQLSVLQETLSGDSRLAVLERDRDELYARIDRLQEQIASLESRNDDRVSTLEQNRSELYSRSDRLQEQVAALESRNDNRVNTLESDRNELFDRYDRLMQKLSESSDTTQYNARISILEKDRSDLFLRYDELVQRVDTADHREKEDTRVTTYVLRKEMLQLSAKLGIKEDNKARIHFVRCLDVYNTGDMNCGPELYFKELMYNRTAFFHSIKDIDFSLIQEYDWVIVGGGGMLDCSPQYQNAIRQLLTCSKRVVSWGLGHNRHHKDTIYHQGELAPIDYTQFFLFTTRDYGYGEGRFCPCVSCMMEGLSQTYVKKRRIGVLTHHEIKITEFDFDICNNSQPIGEIIQFIGESEVIITNTYHGSYWATLMGKKVIIYHPFSNRFDYVKYPLVRYSGDLEEDIKQATTYPKALQECRQINIALKDELLRYMETD